MSEDNVGPWARPPVEPGKKVDGRKLRTRKPPGVEAQFRTMWRDGTSVKAMMHYFDVSRNTLNTWRMQFNLPTRWIKGNGRNREVRVWLTPKELENVMRRAAQRNQSVSSYMRSLVARDLGT